MSNRQVIDINIPPHTGEKYFTDSEVEHIDAFLAMEITTGRFYTNKNGDRMSVLRIFLPYGVRTADTVYNYGVKVQGFPVGTKYYHTPCAKRVERDALLIVNRGGKDESMTSGQFMKWAGDILEREDMPQEPPTVVPVDMILAQQEASVSFVEKEKKDKEPVKGEQWAPVVTRRRPARG